MKKLHETTRLAWQYAALALDAAQKKGNIVMARHCATISAHHGREVLEANMSQVREQSNFTDDFYF